MKRIVTLLMVLVMILCALSACGNDVGEKDKATDAPSKSTTAPADSTPEETEPSKTEPGETEPSKTEPSETEPSETEPSETEPTGNPNAIDDYEVVIDSFRLVKDYKGRDSVAIKYLFTNVSGDEDDCFAYSLDTLVFQNGVSLPSTYCTEVDTESDTADVAPGTSIEVEIAYLLSSATADLEVEIRAFYDITGQVIKKTFTISDTPNQDVLPEYPPLDSANNVDDYNVVIDSFRLGKNSMGKDLVYVKYLFTNLSETTPAMFRYDITNRAFQNGISLEQSYEGAAYGEDPADKYIQPGVTLEVEIGFELSSLTADVYIDVRAGYAGDKVNKVFTISDTPNQDVLPEYPPLDSANNVGDYNVVIDSIRLHHDTSGEDIVIIKYLFTNVSGEDPANFLYDTVYNVYQNGQELEQAYFLDDEANYSNENLNKDILAGTTLEIEVAYELTNTTDDIQVEVYEGFSFDDIKLTKTFPLNP